MTIVHKPRLTLLDSRFRGNDRIGASSDKINETAGISGHQRTYLNTIGVQAKLGELILQALQTGLGASYTVHIFTGLFVAAEH